MKIAKRIFAILIILAIGILIFIYYGNYSKGTRAGVIMKISEKGAVFKTLEGQMNLETFGAVKGDNYVSETFNFSVEKGNPELVEELKAVALSGERVNLKYKEKFIKVFWRGDTKYFATGVERLPSNQNREEKKRTYPRN